MKHLVKDLFMFGQQKCGSKDFGKVMKDLMTLSIQRGIDFSMMTLSWKLWRVEPRTAVRKLAQNIGKTKSTISWHLLEIGKKKKMNKWVPHELTWVRKMMSRALFNTVVEAWKWSIPQTHHNEWWQEEIYLPSGLTITRHQKNSRSLIFIRKNACGQALDTRRNNYSLKILSTVRWSAQKENSLS